MSVIVDRSTLRDAVEAERATNQADARCLEAVDAYYETRMSWPEAGADARSRPSERSVTAEVAAALALSESTVRGWLTLWSRMRPAVKDAFVAGDIGQTKCRVIKTHTDGARADALREIESAIVACASVLAPTPLGREIDRLLSQVDPEWDAESRRRARRTEPKVSITRRPRGMAAVTLVCAGEEAAEIEEALRLLRRRLCPSDPRSINLTRAHAFLARWRGEELRCECGRRECPYAETTAARGLRPELTMLMTCDLETVLGVCSADARIRGFGPIDAETCRRLAEDATWQAIFLAGRRFLDTLTGGDEWDTDPADDDRSTDQGCACSCGRCCSHPAETEDARRLGDLLARAHAREDARTRRTEEANRSLHRGDAARPDVAADSNIVLGRSRARGAGWMPDAAARAPGGSWSAADTEALWRRRIESEPGVDHREFPDGHGGFATPPPGALTYAPSAALAALVRARYPRCVHAGCEVPSERCDLDHSVPFDHDDPLAGGWTIESNLKPKCRGHHNLKTEGLWTYDVLPGGTVCATDPLGNIYFSVNGDEGSGR